MCAPQTKWWHPVALGQSDGFEIYQSKTCTPDSSRADRRARHAKKGLQSTPTRVERSHPGAERLTTYLITRPGRAQEGKKRSACVGARAPGGVGSGLVRGDVRGVCGCAAVWLLSAVLLCGCCAAVWLLCCCVAAVWLLCCCVAVLLCGCCAAVWLCCCVAVAVRRLCCSLATRATSRGQGAR